MTSTLVTPQDYAQPKHRVAAAPQMNGSGAPTDYSLHPKAQEAAAVFSEAMRELDNGREMIRAMQHKIDVQEATIHELQYAVDAERQMKERYQRYCVTVQTLIESISRAAKQAADAAYDQAVKEEPKKVAAPAKSPVETEVEAAIRDMKAASNDPLPSYLAAGPRTVEK